VVSDEDIRGRLQEFIRKQFWSGDIQTRHFGQRLYRNIPNDDGLKLKSFRYSSPGMMELSGVVMVLLLLSRVARSWIATGSAGLDLWKKVDDFFAKRKQLRRPAKKFEMNDELADNSDQSARYYLVRVSNGRAVRSAHEVQLALTRMERSGAKGIETLFDKIMPLSWQRQELHPLLTRTVGTDAIAVLFFLQGDGLLGFTRRWRRTADWLLISRANIEDQQRFDNLAGSIDRDR